MGEQKNFSGGLIQVILADGQVALGHIEGGVTKHLLEGVDGGIIPEVIDSKGLAEVVGGVFGVTSPFTT